MAARFEVEIAPEAHQWLSKIKEKKILGGIYKVMESLTEDPSGQALEGALKGYRSIPAWNALYRILYRLEEETRKVAVFAVGKRLPGKTNDIYAAAERLVRSLKQ